MSEINPKSQSQNTSGEFIIAQCGRRFPSELSLLGQPMCLCRPNNKMFILGTPPKVRCSRSVVTMLPATFLPPCSGLITVPYLFNRNLKYLPLYNIKYLARLHSEKPAAATRIPNNEWIVSARGDGDYLGMQILADGSRRRLFPLNPREVIIFQKRIFSLV